jgi:hypothetical protein
MKVQMNQQKPLETRRMFLKSTGTFVVGLGMARQSPSLAGKETRAGKESLALFGGPKAVTHPHGGAARWPLRNPTPGVKLSLRRLQKFANTCPLMRREISTRHCSTIGSATWR